MQGKWKILYVTATGTSLVFLDTAIMPIAMPTIQKVFLFTDFELPWVLNVYLLCLASLLLIGGRLSDLFGKKALLYAGFIFFGLGSFTSGVSFSRWSLFLGRGLQGVGGALLIPPTGALLIDAFPLGERARALGVNTAISSLFLIIGPALGGILTEYASWRWVFFLNFPMIFFGLLTCSLIKKEFRKKEPFDFFGALTLMVSIGSLVTSLMQGNSWGWTSPSVLLLLILSPVFFFFFILQSRTCKHPLIQFQLFHKRHFSVSIFCIFAVQVIVMSTVIWAIYFQQQLHLTPTMTGLLIVTAILPIFLIAPLGGYFADKMGARIPLLIGFSLLTLSLHWLFFTASTNSILSLLPGLILFGGSIPLILSPITALALSQAPTVHLGAASGMTVETRQLASTTGLALLTAIFHCTAQSTGSFAKAFSMISLVASVFALLGLIAVFFWIKSERLVEE